MNKIHIFENNVEILEEDSKLILDIIKPYSEYDIFQIKIVIKDSTNLELHYEELIESKINILVVVEQNVSCNLLELRKCNQLKAQYEYNLEENSQVFVTKIYDVDTVKELDLIQLNGEGASIKHQFKTIARGQGRYDMIVYHNAPYTNSDIINHGVSIEKGSISFQVTSVVYQGIKECTLNQNNRIITQNREKNNINPILLIEENDVSANHSAYIGQFPYDTFFYLMSRGIPKMQALQLLIKGFLLDSVPETESITEIIEQYWR